MEYNNCSVYNAYVGFTANYVDSVKYNNCKVTNTIADSFTFFSASRNCEVINCYAENIGDDTYAVVSNLREDLDDIYENTNISFINCISKLSAYSGICVHGGSNIKFDNVIIENNRGPVSRILGVDDSVYPVYKPTNISINNIIVNRIKDNLYNPINYDIQIDTADSIII